MITLFRNLLRRLLPARPYTVHQSRRIITRPHIVVIGADQNSSRARVLATVSRPLLIRCLSCERLVAVEELVHGRCEDCQ